MTTDTFTYTGSSESWTAPSAQTVSLRLWGAGGGEGGPNSTGGIGPPGGNGGYLEVEHEVSAGETLSVFVAEDGGDGVTSGDGASGGWGYRDGGNGGPGLVDSGGGGGGAGSTVVTDGSGNIIAVAEGGGGGGGNHFESDPGGGGGGGARGGAGGNGFNSGGDGGGSGAGGDGGSGYDTDDITDKTGSGGGTAAPQGTVLSSSVGGGNEGAGAVEIEYDGSPNQPAVSLEYVDDDQLDLAIAASSSGPTPDNYEVQMSRDGSAWNSPSGGPTSPSTVDDKFGDWGAWDGAVDVSQNKDGFNVVGTADATTNSSFEDIFTSRFKTSDYSNSGAGNYVYMAFAAKWNEYPSNWNEGVSAYGGEALVNPDPDPNNYQLYVVRSDGQNSRDEYFRFFYDDSNDTAFAEIADPVVWTAEDSDSRAALVGDSTDRTVTPNVQSYGPASDQPYEQQVGIDSEFQFRVRAANSDGTSDWAQTGSVYTSPVPPHDPSVSRPDGGTFRLHFTNQSDAATLDTPTVIVEYRVDDGSRYSNWQRLDYRDPNEDGPVVSSWANKGDSGTLEYTVNGSYRYENNLKTDARTQFRIRFEVHDGIFKRSEKIYADYGNEGNVYFEDGFESGDLSKWDETNGGNVRQTPPDFADSQLGISGPDEGSFFYFGNGADGDASTYVQKNLGDLSGESGVHVRLAMAAGSLDADREDFGISWYDGSTWEPLEHRSWEYNSQGWFEVHADVPDSMLSSDNRVRVLTTTADGGMFSGDYYAIDRVVVSDVLHEYTTPAAPSDLTLDNSVKGELTAEWADNASFEAEYQAAAISSDSTDAREFLDANSETVTLSGLDDGEQYEVGVRALVPQYRRGDLSFVINGPVTSATATTLLPAPGQPEVSDITATTALIDWPTDQ